MVERIGAWVAANTGIDALYLLTEYGEPEQWEVAEVKSFMKRVRRNLECEYHTTYLMFRRVWVGLSPPC